MKSIQNKLLKLAIIIFLYLIVDYASYKYTTSWYKKLQEDLPIGTTLEKTRQYLVKEGFKHHISGLTEDWREVETRGFVFKYHFEGIITPTILGDSGQDIEGYVAIRFDTDNKIREIYRMK